MSIEVEHISGVYEERQRENERILSFFSLEKRVESLK